MEARTDRENAMVEDALAAIDGAMGLPLDTQLALANRRLEGLDFSLEDLRGCLTATRDLSFKDDAWDKPLGELIQDVLAQRDRVLALRNRLQAQAEGAREAAREPEEAPAAS